VSVNFFLKQECYVQQSGSSNNAESFEWLQQFPVLILEFRVKKGQHA